MLADDFCETMKIFRRSCVSAVVFLRWKKGAHFTTFGNCWLAFISSLLAVYLMLYNMSLHNSTTQKSSRQKLFCAQESSPFLKLN